MIYHRFSVTWAGIPRKRIRLIQELSKRCEKLYVYFHAEDTPCVPSGKKGKGRTHYWMEISDTRLNMRFVNKTWDKRRTWDENQMWELLVPRRNRL